MRIGGIIFIVYIVVGIIVAATQNYFSDVGRLGGILEAIIAVLVWPVLLFGVDIEIGGGPKVD